MRRKLTSNTLIVTVAAVMALFLTVAKPSPKTLIDFDNEQHARAAPGAPNSTVAKHSLTALDIFNVTLVRIRQAYVESSRINPKEMLYAALQSVQYKIAEVLIDVNRKSNYVTVLVNNKKHKFSTKDVDSAWRLSGKLKRIFRFIKANMNPGANLAKVEYAAVNGMLDTLDPHSVLLNPETAREMDVSTSGKFGGLGIVIRMIKDKLRIVRPIKGTPAHRAGVKRGDHIVQINNELTENLTLTESVNRMRGNPNTSVTLYIQRKGEKKRRRIDITRAIIRVETVDSKYLGSGVGYIRLTQFSGRSVREVKSAMKSMRKSGAKRWILDMRSNPGGLLEQAIKITDLFVKKGTIVTTVGGREREPRRATRHGSDTKSPLVVLLNGNSASASEIVAGALKNLDRALIVGGKSFGKGSVQVLYDNKDGSKLKLTIAQYLTPGDRSIQGVGIIPDVELLRMLVPAKTAKRKQIRLLRPSRTYREADLRASLKSRYAYTKDKPAHVVRFLYERPKKAPADENDEEAMLDDEIVEDFKIKLAKKLLIKAGASTRKGMLRKAKGLLKRVRAEQHKKVTKALMARGVDWTKPASKHAAMANLKASVVLEPAGGRVKAGEQVKIIGTVTNVGSGTAYQVHARSKSDDPSFHDMELLFGKVGPGQTKTWTTTVRVPKDRRDRIDVVSFKFFDVNNANSAKKGKSLVAPLKFRVQAKTRGQFAYSYHLLDDGNGDGFVQKGEKLRLRIDVRNVGKGVATRTTGLLRSASGDSVVITKGRIKIGALKPGEHKTATFELRVAKTFKPKEMVIEMTVYDGALHSSVSDKLKYKVQASSTGPTPASGLVGAMRNRTPIHEAASGGSHVVAFAKRNAVFDVTGKLGRWYRVKLDNKRVGFVSAGLVRKTSRKARVAIAPHWQVTPPTLSLEIPSYETSASRYTLKGKAKDGTKVEDVFIFVNNYTSKIENRKVFYQSNRGGKAKKTMSFAANVPLWPGTNRVTVVARENNQVTTTKTLYLYRRKVPAAAKISSTKR